jgi:hypothetical protein
MRLREATTLARASGAREPDIRKKLLVIKQKYRMTVLELVVEKRGQQSETVHFEGAINPKGRGRSPCRS